MTDTELKRMIVSICQQEIQPLLTEIKDAIAGVDVTLEDSLNPTVFIGHKIEAIEAILKKKKPAMRKRKPTRRAGA